MFKYKNLLINFKNKVLTKKKNGGGKEIITDIILILIGLVLCYLYRDQLKSILVLFLNKVQAGAQGISDSF
ncbi:hypothetical protein [Clostridium paridis]|uniref:Uncharacterized protein n=1 Tax=Clostridium paridis TaxID=2803863 RepID=A0A937FG20_9CLOT|nr:hypothetical protein [Clostridium paridis]MBL4932275.1 hypothetical protein [Clostridium paridis]